MTSFVKVEVLNQEEGITYQEDKKKAKYMPLYGWGVFCTPAVAYTTYTSYFGCVMKAASWKVKVANIFAILIIWCKKKLLPTIISLRKWIQLEVYSHPMKNVWISSLTLILIFWGIELAILRSHRKVYQDFIFNFEDIWKRKFVFYQPLIAFFHTGKPVSSRVLVETSYSDGFHVIRH